MIHKFSMNGYNIVLDVDGGSVHILDDVAYELVDLYEENTKEEIISKLENKFTAEQIEEAYDEITSLKEEGLLFTTDTYEFNPNFINREKVVKALCLHVSHDCNLRCKYCFASQGDFGGEKEIMNFEVGKAAIDYLIDNSGNRRNLEIDFFGGEPLMNFDVVKQLVEYGKNIRFTITTNGVLLDDEKIKYINENMHNVVLSLDGRKEVNDNMRPTANNKGSYDIIAPKFKKLVSERPKDKYYYIRGTFTRDNLDFSEDVLHFANEGFKLTSVEPVVGEEENPYALREEDLPKVFEEYEKLADIYLQRQLDGWGEKFNFFHFRMDLYRGPCMAKRLRGCGAGHEYMAVVPNGDIYPCHQFVGKDGYVLGNVYDGLQNTEIPKDFRNTHVFSKPTCAECWAKFFCSGGCHANNITLGGDLETPYEFGCRLQKKRIECAIMIQAELEQAGIDGSIPVALG